MLGHEKKVLEQYVQDKDIEDILRRILVELLAKRPSDPIAYLISFLENK
jgi:hypothetical protein